MQVKIGKFTGKKSGTKSSSFSLRQLSRLISAPLLSLSLSSLFFTSLVFCIPISASARFTQKVDLPPEILGKMNLILRFNDALYAALISKNEQLITAQIVSLDTAISEAQQAVSKQQLATRDTAQPFIHGRALQDSFTSMRQQLNQAYRKDGDARRNSIKDLLQHVVLITKLYSINHPYKIFFCQADRSVWLQRGAKPRNPISIDTHANCGIQVH